MSTLTTNSGQGGTSGPLTPTTPPRSVTASLGTPSVDSSSRNNAVASRPPEGFYVVLGRGAAATVNLCTLLQSPAGKLRRAHPDNPDQPLRIRVIGLHDPWGIYHPHGMGQPPHLLCMPGFSRKPRPGARTIRSGMHSRDFAEITEKSLDHAVSMGDALWLPAWVPFIQTRDPGGGAIAIDTGLIDALEAEGLSVNKLKALLASDYPKEFPLYRLVRIDRDGDCSLLYAHKIDICTGLGRPQNEVALKTTDDARTQLWRPDYTWDRATCNRPMVTGPEALMSTTRWDRAHRICVFGAGGIGLNMIERAEDVGCHIDWYPNTLPAVRQYAAATSLHRSFNLPRNDTVLKTAKTPEIPANPPRAKVPADPGRTMKPNESGIRNDQLAVAHLNVPLYPASPAWRFANGTLLDKVAKDLSSKAGVVVEAKSGGTTAATIMDYDQNETTLDSGGFPYSVWFTSTHPAITKAHAPTHYDRICFCVGFNFDTELGVPKTIINTDLDPILFDGRVVGLQSKDTRIRMLGAAAAMHPARAAMLNNTTTVAFFNDLPYSAVLPGFIYAGVTIAEANGWFDPTHPNTNINTMAKQDLVKHFESRGLATPDATTLATQVIAHRRMKNGFATPEWATAAPKEPPIHDHDKFASTINGWQNAIKDLALDYGPPRAWIS